VGRVRRVPAHRDNDPAGLKDERSKPDYASWVGIHISRPHAVILNAGATNMSKSSSGTMSNDSSGSGVSPKIQITTSAAATTAKAKPAPAASDLNVGAKPKAGPNARNAKKG
jgi:hypothetical protein